jgi:hypothetical protein
MTKSRERGDNEITRQADSAAASSGRDVCTILADMLRKAVAAGDTERIRKIIRAQKYRGCRNIRKRRKKR